jgi:hypothetical protein
MGGHRGFRPDSGWGATAVACGVAGGVDEGGDAALVVSSAEELGERLCSIMLEISGCACESGNENCRGLTVGGADFRICQARDS